MQGSFSKSSIRTSWQKELVLALFFILGITFSVHSQQYTFHNFTGEDGLSQLVGQALFQDRDGYLWVGTQAGLNRYDGNIFEIFSIRQGLANDWINAISQDSAGTIWVGTNGGLSRWNSQGFINYTTQDGLPAKHVLSLAVDSRGNIWCGTKAGLAQWNGTEFIRFTEKEGLPHTSINALLIDHNKRLWVGTDVGLFYLECGGFHEFQAPDLKTRPIYQLTEDDQNRLWVGTKNGVYAFSADRLVASYTAADGLDGLPISALLASRDGVVWAGTGKGVAMIKDGKMKFITTSNGLPFHDVRAILEDREGIIWLSGFGGVAKFLGRAFTTYTRTEGLPSDNVRPILRDRNGDLWVGTLGGLSRFDEKTWHNFTQKDGLNDNSILCLLEDSHGILWIGSNRGLNYFDGERFYDEPEISQYGRVFSVVEDHDGTLWCAVQNIGVFKGRDHSYQRVEAPGQSFSNARLLVDHLGQVWISGDNGLSRWNGRSWKTFTMKDGLADNEPYFLCEDQQGRIWFGYHSSHGVTYFDGTKFKTYTTADGLSNDAVYSLGVDHHHNLWIGTARGVDRFDGNSFINYGTVEGYASQESNAGGFFADHDGTLWFGTAEGLSHYNPAFDLSFGEPPTVRIHSLSLSNKAIALDTVVTVAYSQNELRARIAPLSYINKKRLKFRYRLIGYDKTWKPLQGYEINYTNLPPGKYTLEVQGRKFLQSWSEPTRATFTIKPPYWRTWWFSLLLALAIGTLVVSLYKYRVYKIQSRSRWLEQMVTERTAELEQQKSRLEVTLRERKRVEEALRKSEKKYRTLFNQIPDPIFIFDKESKHFLDCNKAVFRIYGYSFDELKSMTPFDLHPADNFPEVMRNIDVKNYDHPFTYSHITKDGRRIEVEILSDEIEYQGQSAWISIVRDITERKRAEEELARLASFPELNPHPIIEIDLKGRIFYLNPEAKRLFPDLQTTGLKHPLLAGLKPEIKLLKRKKKDYLIREVKAENVWYQQVLHLVEESQHIRIYALNTTERKQAEEQLKASLREKEVLLKEIHHRVKNNLQIISSILFLQFQHIKDQKTLELFRDSRNRIKSMALIHEKLYQSKDLARIDFSQYIRNLVGYLVNSYGGNGNGFNLHINVESVSLNLDTAIPCGLIINELITNSLKYAFPNGTENRENEIRIDLHLENEGPPSGSETRDNPSHEFVLTISDNGVGFPKDIDFYNTKSLGLQLVNTLVHQLNGTIELHRNGGTHFKIRFSEVKHKRDQSHG